jgi:ubiquinone/menaquinone biosynthesis C-methylase UbiE
MATSDLNHKTYSSRDVVFFFSRRTELQPCEASVRKVLEPRLASFRMLDLGVGAGRTSHHFLTSTASYRGIDYSTRMIEACRKRFRDHAHAFEVGDARAMTHLEDRSFDFVLFSYNGIDYMGHEERLGTLREINRLLDPDGCFCFSTHNLAAAPVHGIRLRQLELSLLLRLFNSREALRRARFDEHAVLRDLPRTNTYYIRPEVQLRQLEEAGFTRTRVFGVDGRELGRDEVPQARDSFLCYLCQPAAVAAAEQPRLAVVG